MLARDYVIIEVVNIHNTPDFGTKVGDLYIGRKFGGFNESKWACPYHIQMSGNNTPRYMVLKQYREYLNESGLINDIDEILQYDRLGCWCLPKPCHGNILLDCLSEIYETQYQCGNKRQIYIHKKIQKDKQVTLF